MEDWLKRICGASLILTSNNTKGFVVCSEILDYVLEPQSHKDSITLTEDN